MLSIKGTRVFNSNTAETKGLVLPSIISPEGLVYTVTCVRAFCREHNLSHSCLGRLFAGKTPAHKGRTLVPNKE